MPPFAAASIWTALSYRRDLAAARLRASAGSAVVETSSGPIEYATQGDGPPLLVVHGAGGGFDQGLVIAELVRGFRVIAPSRFGYLRTPLPRDGSPEAQADAFACLLDRLGVERAAILGVSAGGPSTMQFCLRHPDRCSAMVLLVPLAWSEQAAHAPRLSPVQRTLIDRTLGSDFLFWMATRLFRSAMIESILGTPLEDVRRSSKADQERVEGLLDSIQPISLRAKGLRNDQIVAESMRRYPLERITTPTLVASVENCGYHTYEPAVYTAAHIPGAKFVGYARGGHLWLGHDAELAAEVQRFLSEARASSQPG